MLHPRPSASRSRIFARPTLRRSRAHGCFLSVQAGEIRVVLGENGAGKTTLMKTLVGLIPLGEYQGEIRVDGQVLAARSTRDAMLAGISVIPKRTGVFGSMSVADNVAVSQWHRAARWSCTATGYARKRRPRSTCSTCELIWMRADSLSPHQQRMIVIARGLAGHPKVVVLDEPAASLTTARS